MKVLLEWTKLDEYYPDPTKIIILKHNDKPNESDYYYAIGQLTFNQDMQRLVFSGYRLSIKSFKRHYLPDIVIKHSDLHEYRWDYYLEHWESHVYTDIDQLFYSK